jgi:hypothetical protein
MTVTLSDGVNTAYVDGTDSASQYLCLVDRAQASYVKAADQVPKPGEAVPKWNFDDRVLKTEVNYEGRIDARGSDTVMNRVRNRLIYMAQAPVELTIADSSFGIPGMCNSTTGKLGTSGTAATAGEYASNDTTITSYQGRVTDLKFTRAGGDMITQRFSITFQVAQDEKVVG